MQALIDGDILVYRIGFACQKKNKETGELEVDPIENCLHSVKISLRSIIEETKADSYRLFLTGKGNFRESLVDYYKMNRKDASKPVYYDEIRNYMIEQWNAELEEGQEADDALSIAQMEEINTRSYSGDCGTVIVTIDKDLKNTPGNNYNFVKKEWEFITPEEADTNFYSQLISGDMTDNIPGLYQITGTKALAKFYEPLIYMDNPKDMWAYVVQLYTDIFIKIEGTDDNGRDIQEAVTEKLKETGILLWMRREENEIWSPPC